MEFAKRPNKLYELYERVVANDYEMLKVILENKVNGEKSDEELEAECRETGLYLLCTLPDDAVYLTNVELLDLKKKFEDVKDAIDLIKAHRRYMIHS